MPKAVLMLMVELDYPESMSLDAETGVLSTFTNVEYTFGAHLIDACTEGRITEETDETEQLTFRRLGCLASS